VYRYKRLPDFSYFNIMGVVLISCTIAAAHIWGWKKDSPEPGPIQAPEAGRIIAISVVGGLHHRYEWHAA
jgi:hypothetical protein